MTQQQPAHVHGAPKKKISRPMFGLLLTRLTCGCVEVRLAGYDPTIYTAAQWETFLDEYEREERHG